MIPPPTFGIRNVHLIAQHIPHHTRFKPRMQRLDHRHVVQPRQLLILRQRPAIAASEHLFEQLPKFPFLHEPSVYAAAAMRMPCTRRRRTIDLHQLRSSMQKGPTAYGCEPFPQVQRICDWLTRCAGRLQHVLQEVLEPGFGRVVDDLGTALFHHNAAVHEYDLVGDLAGEADLVRNNDHGHAITGKA